MIKLVQGQLFKMQGTPAFAWNVDYFQFTWTWIREAIIKLMVVVS